MVLTHFSLLILIFYLRFAAPHRCKIQLLEPGGPHWGHVNTLRKGAKWTSACYGASYKNINTEPSTGPQTGGLGQPWSNIWQGYAHDFRKWWSGIRQPAHKSQGSVYMMCVSTYYATKGLPIFKTPNNLRSVNLRPARVALPTRLPIG